MAAARLMQLMLLVLLVLRGTVAQEAVPGVSPTAGMWVLELRTDTTTWWGRTSTRAARTERARSIAERADLVLLKEFEQLEGFYLARPDAKRSSTSVKRSPQEMKEYLESFDEVVSAELQVPRERARRGYFSDPLYAKQWHLENTAQIGNDVNVVSSWLAGVNGTGVNVAMVDDGLDFNHPDIAPSYLPEGSYDFNQGDNVPLPQSSEDYHGTRCAAEISALPNNNVCGVGVAFGVQISGIRLISYAPTSADEAQALNYAMNLNHIYSNSWGPTDDGKTVEAPATIVKSAFAKGAQEGRNGLGSIYVFASGNGYMYGDDCNFDGYANNLYSIPIGAITDQGALPYYSEGCASLFGVSFSSGGKNSISTSDGGGGCTSSHSGTSAAAPLVTGMIALALSVRPDLTWRDVQYLVIKSAKVVNEGDSSWTKNGAGFYHHHRYGFGKIDANLLVESAKTWQKVGKMYTFSSPTFGDNLAVLSGGTRQLTYTLEGGTDVPKTLERVAVTLTLDNQSRKSISILLISPAGTVSVLAPARRSDPSTSGYDRWTFTTVRCWGENPVGVWTLQLEDNGSGTTGILRLWSITLYGTDADQQQVTSSTQIAIIAAVISSLILVALILAVIVYFLIWRKRRNPPPVQEVMMASDLEDFDSNPFTGPVLALDHSDEESINQEKDAIDID